MSLTDMLIRIPPHHYIHVLDMSTNITRLEIGPQTFLRQNNDKLTLGPAKFMNIPQRSYCIIEDPVLKNNDTQQVLYDSYGGAKLNFSDLEFRFGPVSFPLYPGEVVKQPISPLQIIQANEALQLRAVFDYSDNKVKRVAGDEWLFEGPGTYTPRKEVAIDALIKSIVLTEKKALQLCAIKTHVDGYDKKRLNGEEWLITLADTESHMPNVNEKVIGIVDLTTLNSRQYVVVNDPIGKSGKPQLGQRKLITGEINFFLQPGERLEDGIRDVYVLNDDEGLVIRCLETFELDDGRRVAGDKWMIKGPCEYVPSIHEEVVIKRRTIPLASNEGVYVRDVKSGQVRAVIGQTYMLNQDEELWSKVLPGEIENLVSKDLSKPRDKTCVVSYKVPHNGAVYVTNYKTMKGKLVFGPDLILLGPEEQFNLLSFIGIFTMVVFMFLRFIFRPFTSKVKVDE